MSWSSVELSTLNVNSLHFFSEIFLSKLFVNSFRIQLKKNSEQWTNKKTCDQKPSGHCRMYYMWIHMYSEKSWTVVCAHSVEAARRPRQRPRLRSGGESGRKASPARRGRTARRRSWSSAPWSRRTGLWWPTTLLVLWRFTIIILTCHYPAHLRRRNVPDTIRGQGAGRDSGTTLSG